jgi:hypothetical protein
LLIRNISSVYHIVAMCVIKHPGHTYGGFGSVLLEPGYDTSEQSLERDFIIRDFRSEW